MHRWTTIIVILNSLPFAAMAVGEQFFTVTQGFVDDVSDNGIAAGNAYGNGHYFRWTIDGGAVDIGGVTPGNGVGGQGEISRDGRYISGTTWNAAMQFHEMSRYDSQSGVWTGFGMVPQVGTQIGSAVSSGYGISGDGLSVVGLGWTSLGTADTHVFQWTEGIGPLDLGTGTTGNSARGNALSYDGNVVVGWQDGPGRQGSVWIDGAQQLIFDANGNWVSEALAVSGDGEWVTGIGFGFHSYRYNVATGAHQIISNVATGGTTFAGTGITDDGKTIVGGTWTGAQAIFGQAVIWQEDVGTMLLSDYAASFGIDVPVNLSLATSISSDGRWIAGWTDSDTSDSWVMRIPFGDFDRDGEYTCEDVDSLVAEIVAGTNNVDFDITSDGLVNHQDLVAWRADAGFALNESRNPILPGDGNLDGAVDAGDFAVWNANKFTNSAAWCSGDFNADGSVDAGDFTVWNANKFQSSNVAAVPEPTGTGLLWAGLFAILIKTGIPRPPPR